MIYLFEQFESPFLLNEIKNKENSDKFTLSLFLLMNSQKTECHNFTFEANSKQIECNLIEASLFSNFSLSLIKENVFSMKIIKESFNDAEFLKCFQTIFSLINGFPIDIENNYKEIFQSISAQIELTELTMFLNDFTHVEEVDLFELKPYEVSQILRGNLFKFNSDDSLFQFVFEYCLIWDGSSTFLFENLDFQKISLENLQKYFQFVNSVHSLHLWNFSHFALSERFNFSPNSNFQIFENCQNGFLFNQSISKEIEKASMTKIKHQNYNQRLENILIALTFFANGLSPTFHLLSEATPYINQVLKGIQSNQLKSIEYFKSEETNSKGLFNFLQKKCNDQNPSQAGIIRIKSSSCDNFVHQLLNWDDYDLWWANGNDGEWFDIDLLNKHLILTEISFKIYKKYFPQKWAFKGSFVDKTWTDIYESDNDMQFNSSNEISIVNIKIHDLVPYRRYRFFSQSQTFYNTSYSIAFYAVEFFGLLLS